MSDGNRVENSSIGGHNIQIGSATGDITLVLDRPPFRLELLTPAPKPGLIPRSQRTPSYLLDAQRQIVPYRPRPETQRILTDWRDDEERFSVRLLSGQGGAGKTRLGGWFATDSHVAGWTVLQATDKSTTLPDAAAHRDLPDDANLLVITDYAERWPLESLKALVQYLAVRPRRSGTGHVRVLLLARPQDGFWESVEAELDRTPVDLAEPIPMPAFVTRPEDLTEAFADAITAFQAALNMPATEVPTPPDLPAADDVSPLTVHMAALAAVHATDDGEPVPDSKDLSGFLLNHERRYWRQSAPGEDPMAMMVMVATLLGPAPDRDRAHAWLIRARLAADPAEADRLITAYDRCYPPATAGAPALLAPLRPDRFAEDFLAVQLRRPRAAGLLDDLLKDSDDREIQRAFLVLSVAAARHSAVRDVLFDALSTREIRPQWLSPMLLNVVTDHAPYPLAHAVNVTVPEHHPADLVLPALILSYRMFATLHSFVPSADASPQEQAHYLEQRANYSATLSNRLARAGSTQTALKAAHETAAIYQQLAETDPDAHLPNFGRSLNNLALCQVEAGERQKAVETARASVRIRRHLVNSEPDTYLPDLATSLMNLGRCLGEAGETRSAQEIEKEAISVYRRLVETEPGTYLPALGISLNNLALSQADAGDAQAALENAYEATSIHRGLAKTDPNAHLPHLAQHLTNLGFCQAETGDPRAALENAHEAIALYRRLAETEPEAHLPGLARSLVITGWIRHRYGVELSSALAYAEEAVAVYRDLAEQLPQAYDDRLTGARRLRDTLRVQLRRIRR